MSLLTFPFLVFWAFLGLKLSGAWADVSWLLIFLPLIVLAAGYVVAVFVASLTVATSAKRIQKFHDEFFKDL